MSDPRMERARRWDRLWGAWLVFVFVVVPMLGLVQHLVTTLTAGRWIFAVFGALAFPIGCLHGMGVWLGCW